MVSTGLLGLYLFLVTEEEPPRAYWFKLKGPNAESLQRRTQILDGLFSLGLFCADCRFPLLLMFADEVRCTSLRSVPPRQKCA